MQIKPMPFIFIRSSYCFLSQQVAIVRQSWLFMESPNQHIRQKNRVIGLLIYLPHSQILREKPTCTPFTQLGHSKWPLSFSSWILIVPQFVRLHIINQLWWWQIQ
ncbi:hypothetical protein OIU79_000176 [Salix purpurea]|uniref:Uncharacterized protein n=1 Tax=Salix purpurea TaxID=77065 RepID=A0A9Q0V1F6_SALPP|nr:hypothetical protein OIU79_000176 [Salix purpurea]